jgi:hypothetical protein
LTAGDDLKHVGDVGKMFQRGAGFPVGFGFQRGTQMDFADFDAGRLQRANCGLRFFKCDGQMADVQIDAQMFVEARVIFFGSSVWVNSLNGPGTEPPPHSIPAEADDCTFPRRLKRVFEKCKRR